MPIIQKEKSLLDHGHFYRTNVEEFIATLQKTVEAWKGEGCKEIYIEMDEDDDEQIYGMYLRSERKETPQDIAERLQKEERERKELEERQRKQYQWLKRKFEPSGG